MITGSRIIILLFFFTSIIISSSYQYLLAEKKFKMNCLVCKKEKKDLYKNEELLLRKGKCQYTEIETSSGFDLCLSSEEEDVIKRKVKAQSTEKLSDLEFMKQEIKLLLDKML
jgi:hypothetical protein